MTTIALIGAGGKMGFRLSSNLKDSDFDVRHVEVSEAGRARLQTELGITCVDVEKAVPGADAVILAVPDNLVGKISAGLNSMLESGTMVITLDAAAPFAGHLPDRSDLVYFVTHPCHPPIFNDETDLEAKRDYFGGVRAKQHIVNALMQGPEGSYELGEKIGRTIYAPVVRSHRVSVEEMALLEPGLSETVCATLLVIMREAMDEVVRRGVSYECARDFLLGHMNILAAVIFDEQPGVFSDACNKAIDNAKGQIMKEDWLKVFEPQEIAESIKRIT
ncbi:semialdehyde dehydrogenase [Marinobacterium aestuarii]|uniref:Semialdehyde dehydrogenase n=1 Tax=Marinobacterium aestuarii TaxID=1821621 RepID=A0A1A9EZN2_9GAMM|nr:phosphogluconate dehydrogenase C-terminal domain-containing protein [Marinobacterium aestuarii]ANG63200.1 semialdehyde dehydrogenase [Marinobacterium aestuarii]